MKRRPMFPRRWFTFGIRTTACLATLGTFVVGVGCAKPITTEYYSRSPVARADWRLDKPSGELRVGVGGDSAHRNVSEEAVLMKQAGAFVSHAAGSFRKIELLSPENVESLDCQIELMLSFEHAGDKQVHYCLGRLIANVYDPAHARLLSRVVKFHEAMYTPAEKNVDATHDGDSVPVKLQSVLFDELIAEFKTACGAPNTAPAASQPAPVASR